MKMDADDLWNLLVSEMSNIADDGGWSQPAMEEAADLIVKALRAKADVEGSVEIVFGDTE